MSEPAVRDDSERSRRLTGAALVLGAASLWATFGIFAKHLYAAGFAPLELASVRAFVGAVGIGLFAVPRLVRRGAGVRIPLCAVPFFVAYGVIGFALFEYVFFAALERTTVGIAVALLYTAPAFVVIASALLWRERIGAVRSLALLLVLTGVLLVTGAAGAVVQGVAGLSAPALLLGLGAGVTYALYTLFAKVAADRYGPAASLLWSFFFAALALALLAPPLAPMLRNAQHLPALLALGIVPTLIPYALYLLALQRLRASTASMLAAAEPAVATLLAAGLLGERFGGLQAAGIALIVMAAMLLARRPLGP